MNFIKCVRVIFGAYVLSSCSSVKYVDFNCKKSTLGSHVITPVFDPSIVVSEQIVKGESVDEGYPLTLRFYLEMGLENINPTFFKVSNITLKNVKSGEIINSPGIIVEKIITPSSRDIEKSKKTMHGISNQFEQSELPFADYKLRYVVTIGFPNGNQLTEEYETFVKAKIR